jgi:RNA-binding protein VTS1
MARSDPMTALLSPAAGGEQTLISYSVLSDSLATGSMQSQMEAKLATLGIKSPALSGSFPSPASPSARNFGRQSLAPDSSANFLSPDTATTAGNDAAATLAQQRAKLQNKANAAHRISAPALGNSSAANVWSAAAAGANQLGQVAEQEQSSPTLQPPNSAGVRPRSMDLSSLSNLRSPRLASGTAAVSSDGDSNDVTMSPVVGGNWASMVNTPAVPMFDQDSARSQNNLDAATMKLYNSTNNNAGNANRFVLDDPKSYRRSSKGAAPGGPTNKGANGDGKNAGVYGDDGNLLQPGQAQPGVQRGNRNLGGNGPGGGFGWNGARSPALSSSRFSDNSNVNDAAMNGLGVGFGLGSPGMMGMNMMGMPGFNMGMLNQMANLNALAAAGLSPDAQAQMFAAQMAAFGGQPGMMGGMAGFSGMGGGSGFRSPGSGRHSGSVRSPSDRRSTRTGGGDKPDEEVDPTLLEDVPAWLRSLRLHKYTPNFEGMTWSQMVGMNEQQLEEKGVAALGARRKMLKTFEQVRAKMGVPEPAA